MKIAALIVITTAAILFALPAAGGAPPSNGCKYIPGKQTGGLECPWKMKYWYDAANSDVDLTSAPTGGCAWAGAVAIAGDSEKPDLPTGNCGSPVYLWAKTCTAAPQTVDFKKKMFLPGVPAVLEASLRPYKRPLTSMDILVNGRVLLATSKGVRKIELKGKAGVFKFGQNTIELSARKGASKAPCSAGVLMELHAHFAADVEATIDPPNNTGSAAFVQNVTVTNHGPSAVVDTVVSYKVTTNNLQPYWKNGAGIDPSAGIKISATGGLGGAPIKDCGYLHGGGYTTYCHNFEVLMPGQSRTYGVNYLYKVPPTGNFSDKWTEYWNGAGDTFDPNHANDGGSRPRGACRPAGNPPPCG